MDTIAKSGMNPREKLTDGVTPGRYQNYQTIPNIAADPAMMNNDE